MHSCHDQRTAPGGVGRVWTTPGPPPPCLKVNGQIQVRAKSTSFADLPRQKFQAEKSTAGQTITIDGMPWFLPESGGPGGERGRDGKGPGREAGKVDAGS